MKDSEALVVSVALICATVLVILGHGSLVSWALIVIGALVILGN